MKETLPPEYRPWLETVKTAIRSVQIKAALAVNEHLIRLYRELGRMIVKKQEEANWGASVVEQLATDLKAEFPDMAGFSRSNLFYMRQFYLFYRNADEKIQLLAGQIPWWHNVMIFSKCKTIEEATFYLNGTIRNAWSRNMLVIQIENALHLRQGKAITNFDQTLPPPLSELAQQTIKDPYIFDFLTLAEGAREQDLERQLMHYITDFLLELGAGFAFVGRQYRLEIAEKTYAIDLLFYHLRLRSYVVIDLKMRAFEPEFAGKMNFYLSAADDLLRGDSDNPSIGIILCKTKEGIEVEYALRNLNKPIGVSDWQLTTILPENMKPSLPSVEAFEQELTERLKNQP
jgi:predicted nuclease of restriction endonuclease-like (RecB) superfamily